MQRFFILFIYVLLAGIMTAQPKREVRAVWLTTIGGLDWPHGYAQTPSSGERQRQQLCHILDRLQRANINTVLIQTRVRGTTIYPSELEPWDGCLSGIPGKSPGYNPLRFIIDECHARGMELHAWVVTIPLGKWNKTGCKLLRQRHPALVQKIGEDGYMNPENPQTAHYLAKICDEITRNYDIDGIHLDYIRYPENRKITISRNQAREHVTQIVKEIHQVVKRRKPWVKISCSPIGKADDLSRYSSKGWNAYTTVCQDATGWLRQGLMDALFPMMYFKDNNFYPFAIDWKEQSCGRIIAPGLGIYFMSPKEKNWMLSDITREMYVLRQIGMGYAYFRSQFFTENTKGIYDFTAYTFNKYPALVPAMTWEQRIKPEKPRQMHITKGTLTWEPPHASHSHNIYYNVYASTTYPVNVNDARNLIAPRLNRTQINIPSKKGTAKYYYAVCTMDRYGNESAPLQMRESVRHTYASANSGVFPLLTCDGEKLLLPEKGHESDADYIIIESATGVLLTTRPYQGKYTDIRQLQEGVYVLRSLNKKGISHRLGYFLIKRH